MLIQDIVPPQQVVVLRELFLEVPRRAKAVGLTKRAVKSRSAASKAKPHAIKVH